ncbi:hypothetical protein STPH1_1091 [Streptomyces sp. OM5714]|nr:hypothetical protein STPH1_1091 [Streptomyces sp. OM5714]
MPDDPGRPAIHALLTDGTTVRIRAVEPEDHARLHRLHEKTSPDNLRMCLFAVRPHSAAVAADHACELPRPGHRALVAWPRGRIIGLAAYDGGEEQHCVRRPAPRGAWRAGRAARSSASDRRAPPPVPPAVLRRATSASARASHPATWCGAGGVRAARRRESGADRLPCDSGSA